MRIRAISKELEDFFNKKVFSSPECDALRGDPLAIMLAAGEALIGIREGKENNTGELVAMLQDTVGDVRKESWCMSLVQSCVAYAETKTGVLSPLFASEWCEEVWEKSPKTMRLEKPEFGCIVIWSMASGSGHTGLVERVQPGSIITIEGNTESGFSPTGSIVRDGSGCYRNGRAQEGSKTMKITGFLKPF